jgi:PiT family inorganic phosphate transporter
MADTSLLVVVVATALAFDFTNGFHDTANAMATSIATGALRPRIAVALSALLNVVGAFLSLKVASVVAKGVVDAGAITLTVVFAGLVGAIAWNLITWYFGIPSSSSHALIGGIVGATLVAAGTDAVKGTAIVAKVLIPAVLAPLVAGAAALLATYLAYKLTARSEPGTTTRWFKLGQIGSASMVSLAHGTNDAQKTMGVITLALIANGTLGAKAGVPTWVILSAALAIGLGTYVGGWKIIRTMGHRLTEITPPQGFAAQSASTAVILASSHYGFPLSTTHVVSGGVIGSGVGKCFGAVRWGLAGRIVAAWLVTIPAAGAVAGAMFWIADSIGGTRGVMVIAAVALAGGLALWFGGRRNAVTAHNVNAGAGVAA